MVYWSLVACLVGVLGTWIGTTRLSRRESRRPPEMYWMLGLAAVVPAWLVAVFGLLGQMTGRFPDMSVAAWWILSSAAGLLGVLVADAVVRRLRESDKLSPPSRYWLLGVATFLPAWGLALLGLLWAGL